MGLTVSKTVYSSTTKRHVTELNTWLDSPFHVSTLIIEAQDSHSNWHPGRTSTNVGGIVRNRPRIARNRL